MWCRLIIEGSSVYEIDEECVSGRKAGQRAAVSDKGRTGKPAGKPENGDVSALTGK